MGPGDPGHRDLPLCLIGRMSPARRRGEPPGYRTARGNRSTQQPCPVTYVEIRRMSRPGWERQWNVDPRDSWSISPWVWGFRPGDRVRITDGTFAERAGEVLSHEQAQGRL